MEPCSPQILCAQKVSAEFGREAWPLSGERRQGSDSWGLFGSGFGLIKTAKDMRRRRERCSAR